MKQTDSGTWIAKALNGDFRARRAATICDPDDFAIAGLLPSSGASMWFGPGSTGKTQVLLWMAAHLASRNGVGPTHWMGAKITKRGHVLVITAEDLRDHIFLRLRDIAHAMKEEFPAVDCEDLCSRIHVIPFLSLTAEEFTGSNPSLFESRSSDWRRSMTLKGIEEFIDSWNTSNDEDDRIIGVIMDSAVSMSGFELTDSKATTEFLFRINRTSARQQIFWTIVGHTPKGSTIKDSDPLNGAVDRLRGSAMWSTTPRTVVELRLAGETENVADIQRAFSDLGRRDIVIVNVVKANSKNADFKPRVLRRLAEGAFENLTDRFPNVCSSWDPTRPLTAADESGRLLALADLIRNLTDGGTEGSTFTREQLETEFTDKRSNYPALEGVLCDASRAKEKSKDTLAYSLKELSRSKMIRVQRNGAIKVQKLAAEAGA